MLSHSCMPFTPSLMSLSIHAAKSVSLLWARSRALHLQVSSSSVAEMSSRDILPWDTSVSLAESKASSSPPLTSSPERTSILPTNAATEWTDFVPALASDLAGDLPWDSLPLPDPKLDPNELNELEQLPLDPCPDTELSPEEEEPDCERCGEGDLAHLRLEGEHIADVELEGRPCKWSVSASLDICVGAVEVEADGSVLAVAATPCPVLWMIASFKTSSAFLGLSKDGVWGRFRLWSPIQGWA